MQITITSSHPLPTRRWLTNSKLEALRTALAKMKPGESFEWDCSKLAYQAARQIGVRIKTRKIDGKGCRVWRAE